MPINGVDVIVGVTVKVGVTVNVGVGVIVGEGVFVGVKVGEPINGAISAPAVFSVAKIILSMPIALYEL